MLGPMKSEPKQRKIAVYRKHAKPTGCSQPKELHNTGEERTDTDKNMSTMFEILRKKNSVKLESLIVNRTSFAQTVENLFALSFLVKDGRVEMAVDEKGTHLVSPRNAPATFSVIVGEVAYCHFVFRYDFKDWKLMLDILPAGEELMPHRDFFNTSSSQEKPAANDSQPPLQQTAQVTKLSINRCLPEEEQSVFGCPEIRDAGNCIRRCKPRLE